MECGHCGAQNTDDDVACMLCGELLVVSPPGTVPSFEPAESTSTRTAPSSDMEPGHGAGVEATPTSVSGTPATPPPVVPSNPNATMAGEVEATQVSARGLPPNLDTTAEEGMLFAGRYEILATIGRGGMGAVYRARDRDLGEEIAIKVLHPHLTELESQLERFKREIITARRVSHENVVRIHDFGESDGEFFISMELVQGGSLAQRLLQGCPPLESSLDMAIQIAAGLGAAHRQNVVHRDIKPANILFDASGRIKIADFGIARMSDSTSNTVGFIGTPNYMSPEQTYNGEITAQTDIYALGVVLFKLLTGRLPFESDSLLQLADLHARAPAPLLRAVDPDLPVELEAVVARALEKKPEDRYASAGQLAEDLRAVRQGRAPANVDVVDTGLPEPVSPARPGTGNQPGSMSMSRSLFPALRRKSRRGLVAGLVILGVAAIAAGVGVWQSGILDPGAAPSPGSTGTRDVREVSMGGVEEAKPTPVGVATTQVPRPTPARTRAPRTPRPTSAAARATAQPAATRRPVARKAGTLRVTAKPWAKVTVDGKVVARTTPVVGLRLSAGSHTVVLTNEHQQVRAEQTIEVIAGRETHVHLDVATGKARVKQK